MPADAGDSRIREIEVVDVSVGGDVHRIVLDGVRPLPGESVHAQMRHLAEKADGLRRLLIQEPYGAEHMCVDLVVPAVHPDAHFGFVIMEVMGYPVYSGSNSLATATALLEAGLVPAHPDDRTDADGVTHRKVVLEAPGGLVELGAEVAGGRVRRVRTGGDDAFALRLGRSVEVPGLGTVGFDLMYTGGFYVLVDADALGLELTWANEPAINDAAYRIMEAIRADFRDVHPTLGDLGPPPFLHFMGPTRTRGDGVLEGRCAAYGHPKVVWRCPTGTGTSARMARLFARGEMQVGSRLAAVAPTGNVFDGRITGTSRVGDTPAIRTEIAARPSTLARLQVQVDLDDPLVADYRLDAVLGPGPDLRG
jgi:proline racemase